MDNTKVISLEDLKIIFGNVCEYWYNNKCGSFDTHVNGIEIDVDGKIKNITFFINKYYFISAGEWDEVGNNGWEVFTLHYNRKTKTTFENWDNIPINDDCLCQHKIFTRSLWTAFKYAWRACMEHKTPKEVNQIW